MPVTIPAPGASPSYRPSAACALSSRNALPGSISRSIRSRTGSLPRSRWRSIDRSSPAAPLRVSASGSGAEVLDQGAHRVGVGAERRGRSGSRASCAERPSAADYGGGRGAAAQARVTSGTISLTCALVHEHDAHHVLEWRLAVVQQIRVGERHESRRADEVEPDLDAGRQGGCCRSG